MKEESLFIWGERGESILAYLKSEKEQKKGAVYIVRTLPYTDFDFLVYLFDIWLLFMINKTKKKKDIIFISWRPLVLGLEKLSKAECISTSGWPILDPHQYKSYWGKARKKKRSKKVLLRVYLMALQQAARHLITFSSYYHSNLRYSCMHRYRNPVHQSTLSRKGNQGWLHQKISHFFCQTSANRVLRSIKDKT